MKYTIIYIVLIVGINYGFSIVPPIPLGSPEAFVMFPPMSLLVGLIFVARDFAQREIGHKVWFAMGAAGVLSYVMADPFVAIASVTAFAISEAADWGVYTYTKKPFADRILISSIVSTPLDSAVFLAIIGHFSFLGCVLMTVAKLLGAIIVWQIVRTNELSER